MGRLLDELEAGRGGVLVVAGRRGMGKSRLLRAAVATATARTMRTAVVSGHVVGSLPLFGTVLLGRELNLDVGATEAPVLLIGRVLQAVQELGRRDQPLLLVLDDADYFSGTDLALLEQLVIGASRWRVGLLVSVTPASRGSDRDARALLLRASRGSDCRLLRLGPLTDAGCADFLRERLKHHLGPQFITDVVRLTEGSPTYLAAVCESLESQPPADRNDWLVGHRRVEALPLPEDITGDLNALDISRSARDLIAALATCFGSATPAVLARIIGIAGESLRAALADLEGTGVLVVRGSGDTAHVRFGDEVIRHGAYVDIPSLERRRLHELAALTIEEGLRSGAEELAGDAFADIYGDLRLAEHYRRAEMPLTLERRRVVASAARAMAGSGRYLEAAELLDFLRMGPGATVSSISPRSLVMLAEMRLRLGEVDRAREALDLAQACDLDNDGYAALTRRLIRIRIAEGDERGALDLAERALTPSRALAPLGKAMLLDEAAMLHQALGDLPRAWERAREALAIAEEVGNPAFLAGSQLTFVHFHLRSGQARAALTSARRSLSFARQARESKWVSRATLGLAEALLALGESDRGLRWMERARRTARRAGDRAAEAYASQQTALELIERGRWDEAQRAADEATELDATLHRERSLRGSAAIAQALRVLRGGSPEKREAVDEPLLAKPASPLSYLVEVLMRVDVAICLDRFEVAAALLHSPVPLMTNAAGWEFARFTEVLPRTGEVAAALRDVDGLRRVVAALQECPLDRADVAVLVPETALQLARLDRLEGRPLAGLGRASSAAEQFAALRYPRRGTLALVEAGLCAIDAEEPELASLHLKRAYDAYESMGAALAAAHVRRTLRSIGRRPRHRGRRGRDGELTRREVEVATLARSGCTNAQIALALDISERTVSTHVHNVFRKLGLRSRYELSHRALPQVAAGDSA